jgi:hypothetical protein
MTSLALVACGGEKPLDGAECSSAEQELFLACVEAGCSASYAEELGATDACAVDGGGSVIKVEAGASCGFTSSGACFVLCDCPAGVGLEVDVADTNGASGAGNGSILEDAISAVQDAIGQLSETQDGATAQISGIDARLSALEESYATDAASREVELEALRGELAAATARITELEARDARTVVVSSYEINCTMGRDSEGGPVPYRHYNVGTVDGAETPFGCILAQVDPLDRPYAIWIDVLEDNTLTHPIYSPADSVARLGADNPGWYSITVNWGNDLNYNWRSTDFGDGDAHFITSIGEVVLSDGSLWGNRQWDNTDPENPIWHDIDVRVVILHDRTYSAP